MTNEMANAEEVERVVEEHLTAGDKAAAVGALLAWARELRKSGHNVDAAAAEERARAIDPKDTRHAPLSTRAASLSSAPGPITDAPGSAPELTAGDEEDALDSGWGEAADEASESEVPVEASATAPPTALASGPPTAAATVVTTPPAGPPTAPPTPTPGTEPKAESSEPKLPISSDTAAALGAASTTPEPVVSAIEPTAPAPPPAMSAEHVEPSGPEILSFNSVMPPADTSSDAATKAKAKELTRTLRSAQSEPPPAGSPQTQRFGSDVGAVSATEKSATAPPPSNRPKEGDPLFAQDDEMFEEDVSDQTSIMGLEERRALQKATRAGDAAALKATAEKIAADHEAAQHAARGGPVSKEDFERPTVPPPSMNAAPEVQPDGSDLTTAPPPPLVDTKRPPSQASPISPLSETVDAPAGAPQLPPEDEDEDESRPISKHEIVMATTKAAVPAAMKKKEELPNLVLYVIAAIVVLAIVAAFALR